MKKLFVYGTLMNDEVVSLVLENRFSKSRAILPDYCRQSLSGEVYPAIRPEAGSQVEGELIENLAPQHIKALDAYEGIIYKRITVTVISTNNLPQECDTYVLKPEYYKLLSGSDWSNDVFRDKQMKSYLIKHGMNSQ